MKCFVNKNILIIFIYFTICIKNLNKRISQIRILEVKNDTFNRMEGVVFNFSLGEFGPSLEGILGPPLMPTKYEVWSRSLLE